MKKFLGFLSVVFAFCLSFIFLMPADAFAWGPMSHVYLGNELFSQAALLAPILQEVILKYRQDFIYGSLMPDLIIGKSYLPLDKNGHTWETGFDLLERAQTDHERSFALGYLSHLAADTVAHGDEFTSDRHRLGHVLMEFQADDGLDRRYWLQAVSITEAVRSRNDRLLRIAAPEVIFSHETNKRLFSGMVVLSGMPRRGLGRFVLRNIGSIFSQNYDIPELHESSLTRIVDVINKGEASPFVDLSPNIQAKKFKYAEELLD